MFKDIDYNKHYVIGTPLVGWKCDREEDTAWISQSVEIIKRFPNTMFFAALELDHRGLEPFHRVIGALQQVGGVYWTYTINDMEHEVNSMNRWIRIETGRNLVREFAQRKRAISGNHWGEPTPQTVVNYDAVLYVDSDVILTPDIIAAMFEVDRPLVGVHVPAYGLHGPVVNGDSRLQEHWTTAGLLLVNSPAYYDLPWHHNSYFNLSDDPTFQNLASRLPERTPEGKLLEPYGMTWVRRDIQAQHMGMLAKVENRNIPNRF